MSPTQPIRPPRTDIYKFAYWDPIINKNLRIAQAHFAYEELFDPSRLPLNFPSYILHPLSVSAVSHLSPTALHNLKRHVSLTLKKYGDPFTSSARKEETFARLRLRSLVTVCWQLRKFDDLNQETKEEIFGEKMLSGLLLEEWDVDAGGNVVDAEGRRRWSANGERLK